MRTYSGLLSLQSYGDADDILFLSSLGEPIFSPAGAPLAEELQWMVGKQVTVRYWITDSETTKEEAQRAFLETLCGKADGSFGARYSEITGYLWTDEELEIGGHSIIDRLKTHVGKWMHLEIEEHGGRSH